MMSDVAPQPISLARPAYAVFCNQCGDELKWQVVDGNAKGNQGRWYAKVRAYSMRILIVY